MCQLCSPPTLSRRRFLALGTAAGSAAFLGACRVSAGHFDRNTAGRPSLPATNPHLAGWLTEGEGATVILQAPTGSRSLPGAEESFLHGMDGKPLKALSPDTGVLVWFSQEQPAHLQELPSLAASDDIPSELAAQPAPTGETRTFGPLTLITRAGWGAAPPQWLPGGEEPFDAETSPAGYLVYPEPLAPWLTTLVVHHAALEFYHGPRVIQRLHVLRNNFADVGYHFFIDGLGQLYEGRPLQVRGAHTGGYNTGTVGVCLLGNFEFIPPVQAQLDTLQLLARTLREQYALSHLAGHRDFQPDATVCPGKNLWPVIPAIAAATGLAYNTGGYQPPPW